MIPLCSSEHVRLFLVFSFYSLFAFPACSTERCSIQYSVVFRTIGEKLCRTRCIVDGLTLNVEYVNETSTCAQSRHESKKVMEIGVMGLHIVLPKNKSYCEKCCVNCQFSEVRSGKIVCLTASHPTAPPPTTPPLNTPQPTTPQPTTPQPTTPQPTTPQRTTPPTTTLPLSDSPLTTPPLTCLPPTSHHRRNILQPTTRCELLMHLGITLRKATQQGDFDKVLCILNEGKVDLKVTGRHGNPPLLLAAKKGHTKVLKLLVERGAEVTVVDKKSRSILHWSCKRGNVEMTEYILSLDRVDINGREWTGRTPLMLAAKYGDRSVMELLVCKGADVSVIDNLGNTILHCACQKGKLETVQFIISQHMSDINAKNKKMQTATKLAMNFNFDLVSKFLQSKGGHM